MNKISIMLVEDHNILREGLKRLIDLEPEMTVVAEAGCCRDAINNLKQGTDVILLDIKLPDGDGLDLCDEIKNVLPKVKVIALTTYDDAFFIKKAIDHGVNCFIPKYASFDEIKSAITITYRNGRYLYPGLSLDVLMNLSESGLSELEVKILQQISQGVCQKNIANELFMSLSTLRRRIKGICTKFGVKTIEEAISSATKKGLLK